MTLYKNPVSWYNKHANTNEDDGIFLLPNLLTNAILVNRAAVLNSPVSFVLAAAKRGQDCGFFISGQKNRTGVCVTRSKGPLWVRGGRGSIPHERKGVKRYAMSLSCFLIFFNFIGGGYERS